MIRERADNSFGLATVPSAEPGLVKDIRSDRALFDQLSNMTELEGILYFTANDGIHGQELWKSDGTPEGTIMVQDINRV